jgi:hypothetical protein
LLRDINIALIGKTILFDCRGTIQEYFNESALYVLVRMLLKRQNFIVLIMLENSAKSVLHANEIKKLDTARRLVLFASRHYLFNVNTVALEQIKNFGEIWHTKQIDPNVMDNSKQGYITS